MTDLEMIKLCAEAMGVFGKITPSGEHIWMKGTVKRYDPLHDDAQAMALEDWLLERGSIMYFDGRMKFMRRSYPREYWFHYGDRNGRRRAIVECVAKMQEAKNETAP